MNPNLFIRFHGTEDNSTSSVALAELGESLSGFDFIFKEFSQILRINIEPEIQATGHREGSLIIDVAVWWHDASRTLPFNSVDDFLQFLRFAGEPLYDQALAFFNSMEGAHKTLNHWVEEHPADAALLTYLLGKLCKKMMKEAREYKAGVRVEKTELPHRMQEALHRLIKKHGFRRALTPMTEDKVSAIEISEEPAFKDAARVDQGNLGDYLADDDKILPQLEDGFAYDLVGTITSLRATRGDRVTFQLHHDGVDYNLDALPSHGLTSKNYKDYYQEHVEVNALVMRTSLYKKPKLRLQSIALVQSELGLVTVGDTETEPTVNVENTIS